MSGRLALFAEKVWTQEAQELTSALRDAVTPPFANGWRLDFAQARDGTSAAQRIDDLGILVLFFGHSPTIGTPKLLVNRPTYDGWR